MLDRVMSTVAMILLLGFLGILLYHLPRLDLGAVIGATLVFAGWDYLKHSVLRIG